MQELATLFVCWVTSA